MRGHWISNTRKFNRHYQSGKGGEKVTPWYDFILPITHADLYWGVNSSDSYNFPLPTWVQNARRIALEINIDRDPASTGILYLCYLYITVILYNAQGSQEIFRVNYWCQYDSYVPTPSSYIQLDDTSFNNVYGNPYRGEPFILDSTTGLYKLRTTQPIIDINALDPTNTGVYRISYQALLMSTTVAKTSQYTRKARLKKL